MKKKTKSRVLTIVLAAFIAAGIFIATMMPFQASLNSQGHLILALLLVTTALWIFKPRGLAFSMTSSFFMASLLIIGLPPGVVFSGFSSPAAWTLIAALFFGFVLAKTGLGRRIASYGLQKTRLSYQGILFVWLIIGIILSLMTPSIAVRVVIVIPVALNCVEICQLAPGSKERSLILLSAWAMAIIPGTGWLTGSLAGQILSGFFASVPELGPIAFNDWAKVALFPISLISILTLIGGYIVLKPAQPLKLSREIFIEEYEKLGDISREEKITGLVLFLAFLFFLTGSLHGIADAAICLMAVFLLALAGIIKAPDISNGINWDLVVFAGTAMSFGGIFEYSGISLWLSSGLVDLMKPIAGNPWIFVYTTITLLFIWRFVDVAVFVPTKAILVAVLPSIALAYGINPLLWIALLCIPLNAFFLSYQNIFALAAEANMVGKGWTAGHLAQYGLVYFIASLLAMILAIPYWSWLGMFS